LFLRDFYYELASMGYNRVEKWRLTRYFAKITTSSISHAYLKEVYYIYQAGTTRRDNILYTQGQIIISYLYDSHARKCLFNCKKIAIKEPYWCVGRSIWSKYTLDEYILFILQLALFCNYYTNAYRSIRRNVIIKIKHISFRHQV
jgi:hypothetical protein